LKSEALSTNSRQAFCLALKAARERNGITLDEIADATKIPVSVFAALERNDLRRWPHGLFGRSFFRDYVRMIGMPVAEECAEFVRLFLDEEVAALPAPAGAATETRRRSLDALRRGQAIIAAAWRRGAEVISQVFGRAPSPRFRVRIKLPR